MLFILAVAIDVAPSAIGLHRLFSAKTGAFLGEMGMLASIFLIPAIIVFFPDKVATSFRGPWRIAIAVLISWFGQVEFRTALHEPAVSELARQRNDQTYDDVGLNVTLLFMGWLPSLLVTLFYAIIQIGRVGLQMRHTKGKTFDHDRGEVVATKNAE
ncbi:MAG: hypothetical protein WKF77_07560 [Planctomycetaceae bacterium]